MLIAAAGAWAATVALARGMAGMTGTMGLGLAVFVAGMDADDGRHDAAVRDADGLVYAKTVQATGR